MELDRRSVLGLSAAGFVGAAGCLSGESGEESSDAPASESGEEEDDAGGNGDTQEYETKETDGEEVPLVPVDEAYQWYQDESARFVDARGSTQYQEAHVTGAALSPAPDGLEEDDPVAEWPKDQRIVCYCGCPHHLSTMRAASLLSEGYREVYAIDEGFFEWYERDYPVTGEAVGQLPEPYVVEGQTDPAADAYAWAWHDASGAREAAPIDADGNYELHLRFPDVDEQSTIRVKTPAYEIERPLGELVDGVVTGP